MIVFLAFVGGSVSSLGEEAGKADAWLIAFLAGDNLATISPEGGTVSNLALPGGEKANLAVSPDRTRAAFVLLDPEEGKHSLMVYHFPAKKLDRVAELSWQPPRPLAFSPDGRLIAVVECNPNDLKHRVLLVGLKGKSRRFILEGESIWDGPVFLGRSSLIWGTVLDRGYTNKLFTINLSSGIQRKLHVSPRHSAKKAAGRRRTADNPHPISVSRDGASVLWLDWGKKHPRKRQLVLVGPKTLSYRTLTDTAGGCLAARYSPDGKKIAFVAPTSTPGQMGIFTAGRDGSRARLLAPFFKQPYRGWMFSWSPDSKRIVFLGKEALGSARPREVYTVNLEGGEPKKLTDNDLCECYPVWVKAPKH